MLLVKYTQLLNFFYDVCDFKENKTSENYMDFYDDDCLKKYSKYCYYDIFLYNYVCDLKKNNLHMPIF